MASKKRPAVEPEDEVSGADDGLDEYAAEILKLEQAAGPANGENGGKRVRDWRDVEKYHEMRELRRQIEDAFWLEEDAAFSDKHHERH